MKATAYHILGLLVLGGLILSGCAGGNSQSGEPTPTLPPLAEAPGNAVTVVPVPTIVVEPSEELSGVKVTYSVTSQGIDKAHVIYTTLDRVQEGKEVELPWKHSFTDYRLRDQPVLTVASKGGSGKITCEIRFNGKVVYREEKNGANVTMVCRPAQPYVVIYK